MTRYGMLINTKKCVGCYACRIACQMVNGLDHEEAFIKFDEVEQGAYPNVYAEVVPVQCMHCEDAPCEAVCPTHATYTTDSGVVLVDEGKCIGCKYCMAACPYGVRYMVEESGDVSKCTFCHHRTTEGLLPACVSTCVTTSRMFGDLNDPDSDISKKLAEAGDKAKGLMEDLGMEPRVYYIGLDETLAAKPVSAVHKGGNVIAPYEGRQ